VRILSFSPLDGLVVRFLPLCRMTGDRFVTPGNARTGWPVGEKALPPRAAKGDAGGRACSAG